MTRYREPPWGEFGVSCIDFRAVRWEEAPDRTKGTPLSQSLSGPSVMPPVTAKADPLCPEQAPTARSRVDGRPPNNPDVADLLRRAEAGEAEAQSTLGWAYYVGNGVPQDPIEAVKWLRKAAAEQGHATGQNWLGMAFEQGKGAPKDAREAVR